MNSTLGITLTRKGDRLEVCIVPPMPVPVAAMMLGRAPEEVAALLPRLFNLCGAAQGLAARLALGLGGDDASPAREMLRDHLAKLCVHWPLLLGQEAQALPAGWASGGPALRQWIWGGARPSDLLGWLALGRGVAPVLVAVAQLFAPGEAVADLPPLHAPMQPSAQENSAAGRVAGAGLMQQAEARYGRGPFWRVLGRVLDLDRLCDAPVLGTIAAPGLALVDTARGTYALRTEVADRRVVAIGRVTPTDHLLAEGGALALSLASLPATKRQLAALVVDILDPCVPVMLREAADA